MISNRSITALCRPLFKISLDLAHLVRDLGKADDLFGGDLSKSIKVDCNVPPGAERFFWPLIATRTDAARML